MTSPLRAQQVNAIYGFVTRYVNITITILDILHRPAFIKDREKRKIWGKGVVVRLQSCAGLTNSVALVRDRLSDRRLPAKLVPTFADRGVKETIFSVFNVPRQCSQVLLIRIKLELKMN
jgi:hypothetical protein